MLSDHVISLFGRTINITSQEQIVGIVVLAIVVTAWAVQLFRRRRVVILHRSAVSDEVSYELSRIADALERIANHPADQVIAAVNRRAEESRLNPLSILGRERPLG